MLPKMSKKGTLTSRTLEKLGLNNFRFRSDSQPDIDRKVDGPDDTAKPRSSVTTIGGELDIPDKHQKKSLREKLLGSKSTHEDVRSIFYVDHPIDMVTVETKGENTPAAQNSCETMQEKKKKSHPEGTSEYTVKDCDTLERIAAHYDTTPSELRKINKLLSTMIFAGQTLYVPDENYVSIRASITSMASMASTEDSSNNTMSPVGSPKVKPLAVDVPLQKTVNSSPTKVPGHAERITPISSPKEDFELVPPHKLSEDEVQQLDQDCMERFIKLNVKHITDGQGVVKGVLLVTPNAVMFDPNVMDPLVIEHGPEKYGMIAPMDLIISAAMYHDIAAMKLRGQKREDGTEFPKHEIYRDKSSLSNHESAPSQNTIPEHLKNILKNPLNSSEESECSCVNTETNIDDVSSEFNKGRNEDANVDEDNDLSDNVFTDKNEEVDKNTSVQSETEHSELEGDTTDTDGAKHKAPKLQKGTKKLSVSFSIPDDADSNSVDESDKVTDKNKQESENLGDETKTESKLIESLSKHSDDEDGHDHQMLDIKEEEAADDENSKCENGDKETRIGNIVYLPVEEDKNGEVTLKSLEETTSTLSKMSTEEFTDTSKSDSNLATATLAPKCEGKDLEKTRSSSTSSLGPFSPTPHLNAFVNYATGFFHRSDNNVSDIKDVITNSSGEEPKKFDIPVVSSAPAPSGKRGKMSRHSGVEVESCVRMDEKPGLMTMDYDRFAPRKSVAYNDPPLYLCLKMGTPQNKNVTQHNYTIESYGKRRKKSEYWFSIPRDKVDHLYAFFVQWSPQIYGDEEDFSAKARGFVVFEEGDEDAELEVLDEHFGPNSNFQKDWEIISQDEYRRRSILFEVPLPLPDMVGESAILTDEHICSICQHMPGRTVGYPWTLIYSTDKHGFSLKTLYRDMQGLDSPVLLVVKDNNGQVFGALTSCELKYSDHFYGTGESFLFTFYPEFKVFNWTGENNFFMKGNKESLSIGAGQGVFGLWFDEDLYHGRTNQCETFGNDLLTLTEDFVVSGFEAWAFVF